MIFRKILNYHHLEKFFFMYNRYNIIITILPLDCNSGKESLYPRDAERKSTDLQTTSAFTHWTFSLA